MDEWSKNQISASNSRKNDFFEERTDPIFTVIHFRTARCGDIGLAIQLSDVIIL